MITAFMSIVTMTSDIRVNDINTSQPVAVVAVADTRAERIDAYFAARNMPLEGYGEEFVAAADKYDLDWRLLPAIGVRESSGGKRLMNNNPFGWGSARIYFEDFSEGIEIVSWNLAGENPNTAKYYKDADIETILYYYNGSVEPPYIGEVIHIMEMFEDHPIATA